MIVNILVTMNYYMKILYYQFELFVYHLEEIASISLDKEQKYLL